MTTNQRKKSVTNNHKRIQKEIKKHMYHKDNSASCKEYKQMRRAYREGWED